MLQILLAGAIFALGMTDPAIDAAGQTALAVLVVAFFPPARTSSSMPIASRS